MVFGVLLLCSYVIGNNSFPKPLSQSEEQEMLLRYADGDVEAKNILVERNLRLVAHIVKKYNNHSKELEDLISVGTIGLIKAITTYKPGKGTKLATYAARCIDNAMLSLWSFRTLKMENACPTTHKHYDGSRPWMENAPMSWK